MSNKEILVNQRQHLASLLSIGLATQKLAELSGKPIDYWVDYLRSTLTPQLDALTPEQMDEAIRQYEEMQRRYRND